MNKIKFLRMLFGLLICLSSFGGWSDHSFSIASGYGAAHIVPIRIGLQHQFDKSWSENKAWPIRSYCEGSVYYMKGQKGPQLNSNKRLNAAALAGVLRFERAMSYKEIWPYIELGVGLSWLSKKEIGNRDLGLHFQFEDRIGIGMRFGENRQFDFGYKIVHFSNAYIGPSNHGINLHLLALSYWFK